ncbi:MAG: hypothetical protein ACXWNK_06550 [Vulcanimicrobiaceae bacterium]
MNERENLREETMRTGDGEPLEEHGYLPDPKPAHKTDRPPRKQELGENPDEEELEP